MIQYTGWSKNQKIGHRPKASDLPDYLPEEREQRTEEQVKVVKVKKSTPEFTLEEMDEFAKQFPDKDIKKAHEGWLDYLASSGKIYKDYKAAFRNTLRMEWTPVKNGAGNSHIFKTTKSGLIQGFCKKCKSSLLFNHEWEAQKASHCGRSLTGSRE